MSLPVWCGWMVRNEDEEGTVAKFCKCSVDFRQQQLVVEWPENLRVATEASWGLLGNLKPAGPSTGRELGGSFHRAAGPKVFRKETLRTSLVDLSPHPPDAKLLPKWVSNSHMLTSERTSSAELKLQKSPQPPSTFPISLLFLVQIIYKDLCVPLFAFQPPF